MSIFNGICRKPHVPREPELRALIGDLNIQLPEKPSREELVEEEEEEFAEEDDESEEKTDDEIVEEVRIGVLKKYWGIELCLNQIGVQ